MNRPWMRSWMAVVVAVVAVVGSIIGLRLAVQADDRPSVKVASVGMPASSEIENEYGIRIERVSLLAEGGIVELRYILLDADAASVIHADDQDFGNDFPHIVDGATVITEPTFHHHGGELVTGRELSILYGNPNSVVSEGDVVAIEIGQLRLDGVPVG